MQRALISQVQKAVNAKYTIVVGSRITVQLPADIKIIMTHLFKAYGKVNEQELQTKYDETKMVYNISDLIDDIFNTIEDLVELAKLAGCPYTLQQQINIGYLIVSKQGIFIDDVRKWIRKPVTQKMYKLHGSLPQSTLRTSGHGIYHQ